MEPWQLLHTLRAQRNDSFSAEHLLPGTTPPPTPPPPPPGFVPGPRQKKRPKHGRCRRRGAEPARCTELRAGPAAGAAQQGWAASPLPFLFVLFLINISILQNALRAALGARGGKALGGFGAVGSEAAPRPGLPCPAGPCPVRTSCTGAAPGSPGGAGTEPRAPRGSAGTRPRRGRRAGAGGTRSRRELRRGWGGPAPRSPAASPPCPARGSQEGTGQVRSRQRGSRPRAAPPQPARRPAGHRPSGERGVKGEEGVFSRANKPNANRGGGCGGCPPLLPAGAPGAALRTERSGRGCWKPGSGGRGERARGKGPWFRGADSRGGETWAWALPPAEPEPCRPRPRRRPRAGPGGQRRPSGERPPGRAAPRRRPPPSPAAGARPRLRPSLVGPRPPGHRSGVRGQRPALPFPSLPPLRSSPAPALPAGQAGLGAGLALTHQPASLRSLGFSPL